MVVHGVVHGVVVWQVRLQVLREREVGWEGWGGGYWSSFVMLSSSVIRQHIVCMFDVRVLCACVRVHPDAESPQGL